MAHDYAPRELQRERERPRPLLEAWMVERIVAAVRAHATRKAYVECGKCGGSGKGASRYAVCRECQGAGVVEEEEP